MTVGGALALSVSVRVVGLEPRFSLRIADFVSAYSGRLMSAQNPSVDLYDSSSG